MRVLHTDEEGDSGPDKGVEGGLFVRLDGDERSARSLVYSNLANCRETE